MAKLADVLGLASAGGVFKVVGRLVDAGFLERVEGRIAPASAFFALPVLGKVRAGLPQGLVTGVIPVPAEGQDFDFVLQIWTLDGELVFESAARAELPQRAVLGFTDVHAHGTRYRVFSVQARSFVIQVAQDMAVRQRMAGALALRTALPIVLLAPLLMLLVGWVVRRTLAPVAQVQHLMGQQAVDDAIAYADRRLFRLDAPPLWRVQDRTVLRQDVADSLKREVQQENSFVAQYAAAEVGTQRLLLVLAMDLDQEGGQFGQLRHRHRAAVDEGARAAVGADHPAQLALLLVVQLVVGQPLACSLQLLQRKLGRKLGARGGVPAGEQGRNVDHLCLRIEPFDEAALIAHLQTFGLSVAKAESRFGAEGKGLSLYCFDPDGNQVELKGPSESDQPAVS